MAREFEDGDGNAWSAKLVSHGNTSAYLNRRVHRPIIQFDSFGRRAPARYLGLPSSFSSVEEIPLEDLRQLLDRSSPH